MGKVWLSLYGEVREDFIKYVRLNCFKGCIGIYLKDNERKGISDRGFFCVKVWRYLLLVMWEDDIVGLRMW